MAKRRIRQDVFHAIFRLILRLVFQQFKLEDPLRGQEISRIHIVHDRLFGSSHPRTTVKNSPFPSGGIVCPALLRFPRRRLCVRDQIRAEFRLPFHRVVPVNAGFIRLELPIRIRHMQNAQLCFIRVREALSRHLLLKLFLAQHRDRNFFLDPSFGKLDIFCLHIPFIRLSVIRE